MGELSIKKLLSFFKYLNLSIKRCNYHFNESNLYLGTIIIRRNGSSSNCLVQCLVYRALTTIKFNCIYVLTLGIVARIIWTELFLLFL